MWARYMMWNPQRIIKRLNLRKRDIFIMFLKRKITFIWSQRPVGHHWHFAFSFVIFLKCDLCFYYTDPFMVCISYSFTIHNSILLQPPLQECSSTWAKSSWFCFNSYLPFDLWRNILFWKFCCVSQANTVLFIVGKSLPYI